MVLCLPGDPEWGKAPRRATAQFLRTRGSVTGDAPTARIQKLDSLSFRFLPPNQGHKRERGKPEKLETGNFKTGKWKSGKAEK